MREHVEHHASGRGRESQRVQVFPGRGAVVPCIRTLGVEPQHFQRLQPVHPQEVSIPERVGPSHERQDVPRGPCRQTLERLHSPAGRQDRVVVKAHQAAKLRVHATKQLAQVVVVAEEGVEPALHPEFRAVGKGLGPRAQAAAKGFLALDDGDIDPSLGQDARGSDSGEATSHDDGRGSLRGPVPGARGLGKQPPAVSSPGHELSAGRRARNECTMPRCQPSIGSVRTSSKPAARSRRSNAATPSNSSTLRLRYR